MLNKCQHPFLAQVLALSKMSKGELIAYQFHTQNDSPLQIPCFDESLTQTPRGIINKSGLSWAPLSHTAPHIQSIPEAWQGLPPRGFSKPSFPPASLHHSFSRCSAFSPGVSQCPCLPFLLLKPGQSSLLPAARAMLQNGPLDYASPLIVSLQWLPTTVRIKPKCLSMTNRRPLLRQSGSLLKPLSKSPFALQLPEIMDSSLCALGSLGMRRCFPFSVLLLRGYRPSRLCKDDLLLEHFPETQRKN